MTLRGYASRVAGELDRVIEDAIQLNPTVLLILSKESVKSDWIEYPPASL
jgi:hypothetical protein